mmetsp:Transcript_68895/g.118272  ORF Transcript_68895/g.118272 Transcript_68895/m.118272 type:complete len:203 (+) Transcript_68895:91-699(+)
MRFTTTAHIASLFLLLAITPVAAVAKGAAPLRPYGIRRSSPLVARKCVPEWGFRALEGSAHLAIILACTAGSMEAVRTDEWSVIRKRPQDSRESHGGNVLRGILNQRRRAARVGKLLGGYTPRITFLAGLMLRSLQKATKLQYIFDPSLGFAAGASLAASFCKREWLQCILLGWGVGGVYWTGFRVHPPEPLEVQALKSSSD